MIYSIKMIQPPSLIYSSFANEVWSCWCFIGRGGGVHILHGVVILLVECSITCYFGDDNYWITKGVNKETADGFFVDLFQHPWIIIALFLCIQATSYSYCHHVVVTFVVTIKVKLLQKHFSPQKLMECLSFFDYWQGGFIAAYTFKGSNVQDTSDPFRQTMVTQNTCWFLEWLPKCKFFIIPTIRAEHTYAMT